MRTFIFTRIVQAEERYSVQMSDDMANPIVAGKMLTRQLEADQLTTAVDLVESHVVKATRVKLCQ